MKRNSRLCNYLLQAICTLCMCVATSQFVCAQTWSVPAKSVDLMMGAVVYIESVYPHPGTVNGAKDTLTGTGILISNKNRYYIVTAKHTIQINIDGRNQQLANDSLFISASWRMEDKGCQLTGLSGGDPKNSAVAFSVDEQDIAVISLQKKAYRHIVTELLKQQARALPITSVSISNIYQPGDSFFHTAFMVHKDKQGKKVRSKGLAPGTIKSSDQKNPIFMVNEFVSQGSDGSPVFVKGKIIGMVLRQDGISSNSDFLLTPYHTAKIASAIKAMYILPLLKKLQQHENTAGF